MADVTVHTTAPLVWEHDGHTFRAVVDVLPDLADWPRPRPRLLPGRVPRDRPRP